MESNNSNATKDLIYGLRLKIRDLMNLHLSLEQRREIDIVGLINLLEECIRKLGKAQNIVRSIRDSKENILILKHLSGLMIQYLEKMY